MKNLTFIIAITLHCSLFTVHTFSQPCLPEGITFSTQSQIDNFQTNYSDCNEIEGDVTINGVDISNLTGLNVITAIGGDILIGGFDPSLNPLLTSLEGLENLSSIGGSLIIGGNDSLTSLEGLNNLSSIGGDLSMCISFSFYGTWYVGNPSLSSLTALSNLIVIGGDIYINGNHALTSLEGLESVESIGGSLEIGDNDLLSSLEGLNNLQSVGGNLQIGILPLQYGVGNPSLFSMAGLDNLTYIGGDLIFFGNDSLTNLTGLENLTLIDGNLRIGAQGVGAPMQAGNPMLINLSGLENLTSISGDISISGNDSLTTFEGLNNLTSIGGDIWIHSNHALTSLTGLNNVTTIGGSLFIGINYSGIYFFGNSSLNSLAGLDGIDAGSIANLTIVGNELLSNCDAESICNYLASPNGTITIQNNAPGCNSAAEVEAECENNCLPEGITFSTQAEIDSFQVNYPGCTEIGGDVKIYGTDISNLAGLNVITAIGGDIFIGDSIGGYTGNPLMTSLTGLDNLTSIGGNLTVTGNDSLTSLTGLENLASIGGNLNVGMNEGWSYSGNLSLISLTGLEGVTYIGGYLRIENNYALTNLTGLENLTSIGGGLSVHNNEALTSLTGLENLTSIPGSIDIGGGCLSGGSAGNPNLANLTGLDGVTSIGGTLWILSNYALTSLTGLGNLSSVNGLGIACNGLTSLSALSNLTSIGWFLNIVSNDSLTSLEGLENVEPGSIGNLLIEYNSSLSSCEVEAICDYLASPNGTAYIYNNAPGCNNVGEVEALCFNSCLPGGVDFYSQEEIDSFQYNYPDCLTIDGDVTISGDDIINLNGLSGLEYFDGNLEITGNNLLTSLSGLGAILSVGGDLIISDNNMLSGLSGFNKLTHIGGNLEIAGNSAMANLAGLETILMVAGDISILDNNTLTSLTELNTINSLNGSLFINDNEALESLSGISNITSIDGILSVSGNNSLVSLYGLKNITPASISDLQITNNASLSECDVQSICEYMASPGGTIQIYGNATGCSNPEELEQACASHCLYDGVTFSTQEQVDNFQSSYPECIQIEGDVVISGDDISNLNELHVLTSIGGYLHIENNNVLTALTGLDNLTFIGGDIQIGGIDTSQANPSLVSLAGLGNLTSIGGFMRISRNPALTSLAGLDNLTSIGGSLKVFRNAALTSLTGLDNLSSIAGDLSIGIAFSSNGNPALTDISSLGNLAAGSITNLQIRNNNSLSSCAVQSICDYLASPNGTVTINNNAPGCNNQQQVEVACDSIPQVVRELTTESSFTISPNPLESTTTITYTVQENSRVTLRILDLSGREMVMLVDEVWQQGEQKVAFNTSRLAAGVYFCVLKTNPGRPGQTKKMIKL